MSVLLEVEIAAVAALPRNDKWVAALSRNDKRVVVLTCNDKRDLRFLVMTGADDRRLFCHCERSEAISNVGKSVKLKRVYMSSYFVYMMTNQTNRVIYAGVTNNLRRRVSQHKDGKDSSFAAKYNVNKLVFCEQFANINEAIAAEKEIKAGSRAKKICLIEELNPNWDDLYEKLLG